MSDDSKDGGGVDIEALEGLPAQGSNGTKKIVPPDSPKLGHLFILNSMISQDGEVQIQRTLVDAGDGRESPDSTEVSSGFPEESLPANDTDPEIQLGGQEPILEVLKEEHEEEVNALPQTAIETSGKKFEESNHDDPKPNAMEKPAIEASDDLQNNKTDQSEIATQEKIKEDRPCVQEAQPINSIEELKPEVEEPIIEEKPEGAAIEQYLEPQEGREGEPGRKLQAENDAQGHDEKLEAEVARAADRTDIKPERTTAKGIGSHFVLPWQRRSPVSHPEPLLESQRPEAHAQIEPTATKTIANPLSGMMKNFKKGIKHRMGGSSKSGVDSAPERILQKSGSRPSPRIVSSLNMAPLHSGNVAVEPESPTTLRRKELDDIISTMPPSPARSVASVKECVDLGDSLHIYDNLPADRQVEKAPETPAEDEICPSFASKPVLTTIKQSIVEKKAQNLLESMQVTDIAEAAPPDVKPPRSPPAKGDQANASKPSPHHLPPPPRPSAPPKVLPKSYTMVTSRPQLHCDDDVIRPTVTASYVHAAPIQIRPHYPEITTSLERPKLYRTKQETKIAKRATLSRPMTMHETTFLVKQKPNTGMTKSFDEYSQRPKYTQKVIYEQKDSITLPKFLLGNKKKSVRTPQYASALATSPSVEANEASVGRWENGHDIAPTITTVQCSMPKVSSANTNSIGVQTSPQKPKPPVLSLHCGASPLKTPSASPPAKNELKLPFIGERLFNQNECSDDVETSLFANSLSRSMWLANDKAEEKASEKLVNRCLQEYRSACARLRSADLQGEFAAFHWLHGDPSDVGWTKRGVLEQCNLLEVFNDPTKQIDFVKLPPIEHSVGSIVYPESTVDELLSAWMNNDCSQPPSTPNRFEFSNAAESPLHPALAIVRLSDLLQKLAASEQPFHGVQESISLAVLLSISQCWANLSNRVEDGEKALLSLDPADIFIALSPNNCLVLFHITDSSSDWNIQKLLLQMCPAHLDSLEVATNACIESLAQLVSTKEIYLPALFQAVASPNWVMQVIALVAVERCRK